MGNYRGNVRCSYCYDRGHNKRTCPERLERLKRNFEHEHEKSQSSQDHYSGYYARQIAKMTGVNPATGEKRVRRDESRGRTCTYCKDYGHNRRTCQTLKSDLARYAVLTREARQQVRDWALQDGVGVGAMVKYKQYGYEEDATLMMVEALDLQCTHHRQRSYNVRLRPISGVGRKVYIEVNSPAQRAERANRHSAALEVVGKLTPEQMAAQIGEEWIGECPDWKNPPVSLRSSVFDKGDRRQFHFWIDHDANNARD